MAAMVIDASVAAKWFLDEEGSDKAREIGGATALLIAPFIITIEVSHALWTAARSGRTTDLVVRQSLRQLLEVFPAPVFDVDLIALAHAMMIAERHPIYDCLYVALAARTASILVTADQRQFAVAKRARIEARML